MLYGIHPEENILRENRGRHMGVRSAKDIIREARLKAGLTQEQASEGICTVQMLSKIETGRVEPGAGVFVALMERIGEREIQFFPGFMDREEYEFSHNLKFIWVYLGSWQLDAAYEALEKLADNHWLGEPLYCQEWLLLNCRLQFCSCGGLHQKNYNLLLHALHMTRPEVDLDSLRSLLLTRNEMHILIALAQEAVYLGRLKEALGIAGQVYDLLKAGSLSAREKECLQAEEAIVYAKCLIASGDYAAALGAAEPARHKMAVCAETAQLLELTFLAGLCCWKTGDREKAHSHIKAAFYTAQALECGYAVPWVTYLQAETDYPLTENMRGLLGTALAKYPELEWTVLEEKLKRLNENVAFKKEKWKVSLSIGDLIRELRQEQELSQQVLCKGLCSKSKLSKIENGTQEPEIMLAKALLRRLGVSDQLFIFYASAKKARFFELHDKVMNGNKMPAETVEGWLDEMAGLIEESDNQLYRQEYLQDKAMRIEDPKETIAMLLEALHITLPDFDIHRICEYRLSRCELAILNDIALTYRRTEESHLCTVYYSQIQAYARAVNLDILMKTDTIAFSNYGYIRTLYLKKLYREALAMAKDVDVFIMKCQISAYSSYLFFYSQVLAECGSFEEARIQALMACGLQDILEYPTNAIALTNAFLQDFLMKLED